MSRLQRNGGVMEVKAEPNLELSEEEWNEPLHRT